jgi:ribosome-associated protein
MYKWGKAVCQREPGAMARVCLWPGQLWKGGPLETITAEVINTARNPFALERAFMCAQVAEDHKGKDILVLDLRDLTPIFDFFVIATGTSRRQIHTLAEEIDAAMQREGEKRLSIQGYDSSRWVAQDYGDVLVHIFDAEARDYYGLEELWADAPRLDWQRG